jgi:broad specificity phosphatase PhoE
VEGFRRWRDAYEAAGIVEDETPPPELSLVASRAGAIVASDTPRALASARLLANGRDVIASEQLRELDLDPPSLRFRLPLAAWALAYGIRLLWRRMSSRSHATDTELQRARETARWLADLSRAHGSVVVITHATFREFLSEALVDSGWKEQRSGGRRHWSVWLLRPDQG